MRTTMVCWGLLLILPSLASAKKVKKVEQQKPLEQYILEASQTGPVAANTSPGSLFSSSSRLADGVRDLRAAQLHDLVTIVVADKASAVSTGVTNTSRKSSATASVTSLAGPTKVASVLSNLAGMSGNQQLQGQGTTSRQTALTTTITAQVTHVLPNGNLVVQGQKEIAVNSERQLVIVRGIVRPEDLSAINSIASDRLAMLEVHITGKGVVNDASKRPFILYRLLLGLLPF